MPNVGFLKLASRAAGLTIDLCDCKLYVPASCLVVEGRRVPSTRSAHTKYMCHMHYCCTLQHAPAQWPLPTCCSRIARHATMTPWPTDNNTLTMLCCPVHLVWLALWQCGNKYSYTPLRMCLNRAQHRKVAATQLFLFRRVTTQLCKLMFDAVIGCPRGSNQQSSS